MNPMVSPVPADDDTVRLEGLGRLDPREQLQHLAGVDLTALDQVDIDYIADYDGHLAGRRRAEPAAGGWTPIP